MSRPLPFAEPDWTAPGQSLLDWLDQIDRELDAKSFEDLAALRPVIEARARAVRQLADVIDQHGNASWPLDRLDAVRERTAQFAARIRQLRHQASQDLNRCGRDRVLAESLAVSTDPVPSQVNCFG